MELVIGATPLQRLKRLAGGNPRVLLSEGRLLSCHTCHACHGDWRSELGQAARCRGALSMADVVQVHAMRPASTPLDIKRRDVWFCLFWGARVFRASRSVGVGLRIVHHHILEYKLTVVIALVLCSGMVWLR